MRKIGKIFYFIFVSLLVISCNQNKTISLIEIKKLDYPSASAVEYYNGKLYIIGDDAANLLILDINLNIVDSIPLDFKIGDSIPIISYQGKRIPKSIKPDLEASALNGDDLFLFGSGSLSPYRNSGLQYNLKEKKYTVINLEPLYSKAKDSGIEQINIEGACFISDKLILVNRGNKSYPNNHLIITSENSLLNDSYQQLSIIPFESQKDTASFKGISGLCYSKENDQLIMTVSTEDTRSVHEDGTIGKSFLWIIDHISGKLGLKTIKPDKIIDLEEIDPRFKGQKIESATIIEETKDLMRLVLVADNDDGSSTVFKMSTERK